MKVFLPLLLLLSFSFGYAQQPLFQGRSLETQHLAWAGYYQRLHLSPQWSVHTELEGRWYTGQGRQHQWVAPRVHVHYQTKGGMDVATGITYFLQALPQNQEPLVLIRPEWRLHQELTLRQPIAKKLRLEHRYRVEERFIQVAKDNKLVEQWEFNWRFRYRAQLIIPILPDAKLSPTLKLYDEVLLQAGKSVQYNIFDQNRIGAALSLKASKNISIDLGYMNWLQQRPSGSAFYSRHIFRFTFIHSLYLYPQS